VASFPAAASPRRIPFAFAALSAREPRPHGVGIVFVAPLAPAWR
jgi:hypothetical protein